MVPAIALRTAVPEDSPGIRVLLIDAFGDEGPLIADLVDRLGAHPCGRDAMSYVAEADGHIVGHVMVTRGRLDAFSSTIDVAVLSPLSVATASQRQGIGRQLVDRAIQGAQGADLPVVFLEGDPAFYSRLGFVGGKPLGFRKPSIRIPDDAFQVMLLAGYEPWMTGTLVYAEPFWDLDCVGLRDPGFLEWLAGEVAQGRQL
jgi:putative acetyltransferase